MNREIGWMDESPTLAGGIIEKQGKMIISAQSKASFVNLGRVGALKWIFAAAVLVAKIAAPDAADARSSGAMRAYDGTWNVVFATRAGNCSSNNSFPFAVSGGRVSSAGGANVTGGVSPAGRVSVRVSLGQSVASGSGRLVGNSGAGRWSGIISGDRCSGSWHAARS
jgi:hypothetical protein